MNAVKSFGDELSKRSPRAFGQWWAIDLHNHTPTSFDYKGNKQTAIADTIDAIKSSDLSIVMFTDHERLPSADFMQQVSKGSGKLILPGVELNIFVHVHDKPSEKIGRVPFFHLLIGFDPDHSNAPEYYLTKIYNECKCQEYELAGRKVRGIGDVESLAEIIREAGAIAIPAHLHSSTNAFKSRSIDDIFLDEEFLRLCAFFTALEVRKESTAVFFDGTRTETKMLHRACIWSSDSHDATEIGRRCCYAQMEKPSFGELKAALELPHRVSLHRPVTPSSYVAGVNINGAFLNDFWLSLSPHCNALIGVKGSGKTSVLECLRFVLGVPVPESRKETVTQHLQSLLGVGGTVKALLQRKDGSRILVERSHPESQFKVMFEDGHEEYIANQEGLHFQSYILGWHEIENAATDSRIRRVYLDTIAGQEKIREFTARVDASTRRIKALHEEASTKYDLFAELDAQVKHLQDLRKGLEELVDADLVTMRDKYERALERRKSIATLDEKISEANQQVDPRLSRIAITNLKSSADDDAPISKYIAKINSLIDPVRAKLAIFGSEYKSDLDTLNVEIKQLAPQLQQDLEDFFGAYKKELAGLPEAKRRLLETHQAVSEQTQELPALLEQRDNLKSELEEYLGILEAKSNEVASALDARAKLRSEKVTALNEILADQNVKLVVEPLGMQESLASLRQSYSIGGQLYDKLFQSGGSGIRHHRRLAKEYARIKGNLGAADTFLFSSVEMLYFLDWYEEDDLKIFFKVGKAGEEFSPIDQMSAGQRCTAIFPLLLLMQEGPLIVDQPEDNLDNRHIARNTATALMKDKKVRQILFTSHNANLVVLTDSEQICCFDSTGSKGFIEGRGFLASHASPIRPLVLDILDGGETALKLRQKKYGVTV